jgi:TPR repeat protein
MEQSNLRDRARAIALCCLGISNSWAIAVIQIPPPPSPLEITAVEADAQRGDVSAQRRLAWWYEEGRGVRADARQAAKWYLKAAKQGDTLARYKVARLYESGRGVIRSHSKAVKWYRKEKSAIDMAAGRNADAGWELASEYRQQGNLHLEAEWLGICAEEGNSWCRHTLARDYRNGSAAFPQNFAKAMAWFLVLADERVGEPDHEPPSPEYEIGQMYAIGQGVAQNYRKAMEWYVRGANTADSSVLKTEPEFALGDLYEHGRGVTRTIAWRVSGIKGRQMADSRKLGSRSPGCTRADKACRRAIDWPPPVIALSP